MLEKDFQLLRNILEDKHPSIYWYTSKDSMDLYFDKYYSAIKDSMTEQQYAWHVLSPLIDKIHCGHTSLSMSKAYSRWAKNRRQASFPLYLKVWDDTMAITANLNRKDSIFKPGMLITSINGVSNKKLISQMFTYLPEDGHANNVNYMRLSGNFPYFHRNIYGLNRSYQVSYIDSLGKKKTDSLAAFIPAKPAGKDSLAIVKKPKQKKIPKEKRLLAYRSMVIDSNRTHAVMTIHTFSKGKLRGFYRKSFKQLEKEKIPNLVIDLRLNGGGRVGLSTLLTQYVSRHNFKVADTLVSSGKSLGPYTRHIKGKFLNNLELWFITRKQKDGRYHISHLEKKVYTPKKNNHFDGNVYILTSGLTFSASTLFCNAVKGQQGITIVGEETGGGWHGNNGIMIPDIILPNTGVRVRLPLFRLVQYKHPPKDGRGVIPDVLVNPNYEALKKGVDYKLQVTRNMILKDSINHRLAQY